MPYNITASTFTANNFSNNINSSICLTNFLPAKKTCKKAVYTSHEVIRQQCLPETSANANQNATSTFPRESENGTEKLPADVSQFYFSESQPRVQREWNSLASLGCTRAGCIRCKMACHFAKLAYHPRHDSSGF